MIVYKCTIKIYYSTRNVMRKIFDANVVKRIIIASFKRTISNFDFYL